MKLKITATNEIERYVNGSYIPEIYSIEYKDEDTLEKIKRMEYASISFNEYYNDKISILVALEDTLPFIIKNNGKVEWDVNLNTVLIKEFINTHKININDGIYLEYGYIQAGGPGLVGTLLDLWEDIYPFLEVVATIGGVAQFVIWIKNIFKNKIPHPHSVINFIYNENKWNYIILSEKINFNQEDTKNLLLALGYRWNNSQKTYCISDEIKLDKIAKINKINIFGLK